MSDIKSDENKYYEGRYKKLVTELELRQEQLELQRSELDEWQTRLCVQSSDLQRERERLSKSKESVTHRENYLNYREERLDRRLEHYINLDKERFEFQLKEQDLQDSIHAVSELPTLDSVVQSVLEKAVIDVPVSGTCDGTMQVPAMEYLKLVQASNRKRLGLDRFPDYPGFPPDNPYDQSDNEWNGKGENMRL